MTTTRDAALEACPFCGGEAEAISLFPNDEHKGNTFVKCVSCGASCRRGHADHAIAAWNRRTAPPPDRCPRCGGPKMVERFVTVFDLTIPEDRECDCKVAPQPAAKYPVFVAPQIVQYDEHVFVWLDETGGVGGAEMVLETAQNQMARYAESLEKQPAADTREQYVGLDIGQPSGDGTCIVIHNPSEAMLEAIRSVIRGAK